MTVTLSPRESLIGLCTDATRLNASLEGLLDGVTGEMFGHERFEEGEYVDLVARIADSAALLSAAIRALPERPK